jgi:hypothetical protein
VIPVSQLGIRDVTDLNSSWPGILLEYHDFLESSVPAPGKPLLRQKFSLPRRVNPLNAEVFQTSKGLISDIPGFPAGDRDNTVKFLTVLYSNTCTSLYKEKRVKTTLGPCAILRNQQM